MALAVGLPVAAGIGLAAWYFSSENRLKRELRKVPAATIAAALEGQPVRVSGVVGNRKGETPLSSPIRKRECVAWRIVVQRHVQRGKSSYWKTIVDESDSQGFLLRDETGLAEIPDTHLDLVLDFDAKGAKQLFAGLPPELIEFCRSRGIDTQTWLGIQANLRYSEGVLEPGETATLGGVGRWQNDPSQHEGYRGVGRRLVLSELPSGRLIVTDHEGEHRP